MKRRRFRFSLLSFFVIVTLIGVSMGVWLGMIGPIRSQWRSAEIILESGASLETSPSSIPRWMKSLLPEGQCDNIVAVDFKRQNATDAAIKALEDLPHLQRLYLQRTNLQPAHIDSIVGLPEIKTLSVWGNPALREPDICKLAEIDSLELVDFHVNNSSEPYASPPLNWKVLLAFADRPSLRVKHDCFGRRVETVLESGDVPRFYALKKKKHLEYFSDPGFWKKTITIRDAQASDLHDIVKAMPDCRGGTLTFRKLEDVTDNIPLLLSKEDWLSLWITFSPPENVEEIDASIEVLTRSLDTNFEGSATSLSVSTCRVPSLELHVYGHQKSLMLAWPQKRFGFEQLLSLLWDLELFGVRSIWVTSSEERQLDHFLEKLESTEIREAFPKLKKIQFGDPSNPRQSYPLDKKN